MALAVRARRLLTNRREHFYTRARDGRINSVGVAIDRQGVASLSRDIAEDLVGLGIDDAQVCVTEVVAVVSGVEPDLIAG